MRVLVVEDEPDLLDALSQMLREDGYAVDTAKDGEIGGFKASSVPYDAIVLDIMLPKQDGLDILRMLRRTGVGTPVLLLSARDLLRDRVHGLDCGADDYVLKPFANAELLARLRAIIRRNVGAPNPKIAIADLIVDTARKTITKKGRLSRLTAREYALAELLALHAGEVVTRTMIYDHLFSDDDDTMSNVVDVFIHRLRTKLGRDLIETRRGFGYVMSARHPVARRSGDV